MFKSLAGIALVASLITNLSAEERDHKLNFDNIEFKSSGRYSRHLIQLPDVNEPEKKVGESFAYVYGKAKLAEGRSGKALDFSDSRSRTEFRIKSGRIYDHNSGTIDFWLAPTKEKFGTAKESVVFEESNGDTVFGLYVDAFGKLKLKVSAKFPLAQEKVDDIDKYNEKYFKAIDKPQPKKFDNTSAIDKAIADKKAKEDAAKLAKEEADKPTFDVKEFVFHSFQLGDTSNWPVEKFQNVIVTWDLRKGFFAVLVNGKYAIRSYASEGNALGMFLDRGKSGSYITFGKGNDGFSAKIDDLVISKEVRDVEFDIDKIK